MVDPSPPSLLKKPQKRKGNRTAPWLPVRFLLFSHVSLFLPSLPSPINKRKSFYVPSFLLFPMKAFPLPPPQPTPQKQKRKKEKYYQYSLVDSWSKKVGSSIK